VGTIGAFCFLLGKQNAQRRNMSQLILEGAANDPTSDRAQVVQILADFRREWQTIAEGKSLIEIEVPVGLVLADIADWLQLDPQERQAMLGGKLISQINHVMEERVGVAIPS
jgi:hypothetical protein